MDSVIFSVWADPDLGEEYYDDLVGVDILRNAGFTYNGDDSDPIYGAQIPSFFMDFLSGPAVYIPGETFIDNDGDGIYTPGIDTPLDTAFTHRGQVLGITELPGIKILISHHLFTIYNPIHFGVIRMMSLKHGTMD